MKSNCWFPAAALLAALWLPRAAAEPYPTPWLAVGPMEVSIRTVTEGKPRQTRATLRMLLPKLFVYDEISSGVRFYRKPGEGDITAIDLVGSNGRWEPERGEFRGRTIELKAKPFVQASFSRSREERYLFLSLERSVARIERAVERSNKSEADEVVRRAAVLARHMAQHDLAPEVRKIFDALPAYRQGLEGSLEKCRSAMAEFHQKRMAAEEEFKERRNALSWMHAAGMMESMLGFMPRLAYRPGDWNEPDEWSLEENDPSAIWSGMGTMYRAQMENSRNWLEGVAKVQKFGSELRAAMTMSQAEYWRLTGEMRSRVGVAGKPHGVDPERDAAMHEIMDAMHRRGRRELGIVVRALEERAKPGGGGPDDPITALTAQWLRLKDRSLDGRVALARKCADRTLASAGNIPPAAAYDGERAEVIAAAAQFADQAALFEVTAHGSWAEAFNPHAAYAVRILDLAAPFVNEDRTGRIGELRAWALLKCGQARDALKEAKAVAAERDHSSEFHHRLANTYVALADNSLHPPRMAVTHIAKAILRSAPDIRCMRENRDFKRFQDNAEFKKLVGVRVRASVADNAVSVVNLSPFRLTRVRMTLEIYVSNQKTPRVIQLERADELYPAEMYHWDGQVPPGTDAAPKLILVVKCAEGEFKIEPSR